MLRSVRAIVCLALLTIVVLLIIVGWATGFFGEIGSTAHDLWSGLMSWLDEPFGWDHALAALGVLAAPIVVLVIVFAIADD